MVTICIQCKVGEVKKRRFCSLPCYWVYLKQSNIRPPSRTGISPWNKGKKNVYSKESLEKMSKSCVGREHSLVTRIKMSEKRKGERCHLWRGGITPINQKIRSSFKYKEWRIAVFKRDDFTCQFCGERGGSLHADHIKPFSLFPDNRFDLSNGRTLCVECHKETDTYLHKIRNYQLA